MSIEAINQTVKKLSSTLRATQCQRFFKTGKGQYAEGDIFAGITNSQARAIAKQNSNISLKNVQFLLSSKIHEQRFIALIILIHKFKIPLLRQEIFNLYLKNTKYINNWDLVDCSAQYIIGQYLKSKSDRSILCNLAISDHLWQKRISIISTHAFIKIGQFDDTLSISEILLDDSHDLIHKAVGWMLREVGIRKIGILENFIKTHYDRMPRTTLRYAIQKFPQNKRKAYLKKQF